MQHNSTKSALLEQINLLQAVKRRTITTIQRYRRGESLITRSVLNLVTDRIFSEKIFLMALTLTGAAINISFHDRNLGRFWLWPRCIVGDAMLECNYMLIRHLQ